MKAGFDYFRRLRRMGFEVPDQAACRGRWAGRPPRSRSIPTVRSPRCSARCRPARRPAPACACASWRCGAPVWDEYFDHDSLDALAAALTAWRFQQGRATPLGDPAEGLIWLPVSASEVRDTYTAS